MTNQNLRLTFLKDDVLGLCNFMLISYYVLRYLIIYLVYNVSLNGIPKSCVSGCSVLLFDRIVLITCIYEIILNVKTKDESTQNVYVILELY